ncbi:phosphotransferase [Actinacidiphila bryophytorum]|uniref:Aminoglycoside phosphotransferase family protein n=1 Tax=Actinacidiphila bryophytorum TaxID=1436133 RepID=A0A9W4MJ73_9ACTN|nr:aminoglycoside phosphotransferase family protein [Actinacidiphila bryophytorum]MBM9435852.1 aminoglycoside phosphotransferase family protein [Actinacidiphila bryophytorum]MBN6543287.1 aminoglycoside phosphotransferase family protein [Actinacidiphila bryophytorum]CAG7649883.1 Aminoglycoside phosphotransferase family protein [Actinacidiphila bryophytorum]
MELIGRGREADVYALGEDRVLRRFRDGRPAEHEARVMRWLGAQGYPVPAVHEAAGTDLVMERLHGPTMSEALRRRPWRAVRYGALLGRLHRQLHALAAPEWLPRLRADGHGADTQEADGQGAAVLHLDLHPDNVMLTGGGPRVIDWANAHAGPPEVDVAMTFVILRGIVLRPHERLLVRGLLRSMARSSGADRRAGMPAATQRRLADPNLTRAEEGLVHRLQRRG